MNNQIFSIKFLPSSLIGQIESCLFVNVYVNRIFIKAGDTHTHVRGLHRGMYVYVCMCAPLYLVCCNCRYNNEIGLMLMRLSKLVIPENAVSHCEKRIEEHELQPVASTLPWIGSRPNGVHRPSTIGATGYAHIRMLLAVSTALVESHSRAVEHLLARVTSGSQVDCKSCSWITVALCLWHWLCSPLAR